MRDELMDKAATARRIHSAVLARVILRAADKESKIGFKHNLYKYLLFKIDQDVAAYKINLTRGVIDQLTKREHEMGLPEGEDLKRLRKNYYRMLGKKTNGSFSEWREVYLQPITRWMGSNRVERVTEDGEKVGVDD